MALDVTSRCNLRCLHCYWWKEAHAQELDAVEMIALMKRLRASGLRAALLYGGEPTLGPEVCRAADDIFDSLLIFTNGTNGFPRLRNGQWILSLDGPKDINDRIRGPGVFDRAIEGLHKASRPPLVHITLSCLNAHSLEEFVRVMMDLPIKGMGFSFYTPTLSAGDGELAIPLSRRDGLVKELVSLRKRYGEKVGFTPAMARQLLSTGAYKDWNQFSHCPVSERVLCLRADGSPKRCTYGNDADCSQCGCAAVVVYRGAFYPPNVKTLRLILGLMIPRLQVLSSKRP